MCDFINTVRKTVTFGMEALAHGALFDAWAIIQVFAHNLKTIVGRGNDPRINLTGVNESFL